MQLTVLGSGTATPHLKRNSSGLAVLAANSWILVDIGPGTLRRLCEAEIDRNWIDFILVTHFHVDHVGDLAAFLFASNYAYGPGRKEPFSVIGPQGLEQFNAALVQAFGHWIIPTENRLRTVELDAKGRDALTLDSIRIHSAPSLHSFPSVSYRIEAEGKAITVSGDTDFSPNIIELASRSNVLVCECSLPDDMKAQGHLTPSEAGRIAAEAQVEMLILTHFYPPCDNVDVVRQAEVFFSGQIVKASDLMVFAL